MVNEAEIEAAKAVGSCKKAVVNIHFLMETITMEALIALLSTLKNSDGRGL